MASDTGNFILWGSSGQAVAAEVNPLSIEGDVTLWGSSGAGLAAQIQPSVNEGNITLWGSSGVGQSAQIVMGGAVQGERAEMTLALVMVPQAEVIELDLELHMLEYGQVGMPLELLVFDPSFVNANPLRWSVKVTLNGVDQAAKLVGTVEVDAEEGLARTATFSISPTGSIAITDWVGKPVTVDFQQIDTGGNPLVSVRVFTGLVDIPNYDPTRGIVEFNCIDNLNGIVGQHTRTALDQLIQGWWSPFVFDPDANSLEYAQAELSTVPKSLDLSPYQAPRVTAWAAKATPDFTFDAATKVLHDSVTFEMANRSEIKNVVNLEMQYRFPRLRARRTGVSWSMPTLFSLVSSLVDFSIPTKSMVESTVNGLGSGGWHILGVTYAEPPVSQLVNGVNWVCEQSVATALAWAVGVTIARKWVQTVTEIYYMKVICEASVTQLGGELTEDETIGMDVDASAFDASGWEADLQREPTPSYAVNVHTQSPPWLRPNQSETVAFETFTEAGADWFQDMTDVPGFMRTDFEYALQTALNKAKTLILATHRRSSISCTVPLNPFVDLIHTATVSTPKVSGKGKITHIVYSMDIDQGQATMVVDIAISGTGFVGAQIEDPLAAPPQPDPPVYTPPIAKSGETHFGAHSTAVYPQKDATEVPNGYFGNRRDTGGDYDESKAYSIEFRLQAPAIADELTQPLTIEDETVTTTVRVAVPEDTLTITG